MLLEQFVARGAASATPALTRDASGDPSLDSEHATSFALPTVVRTFNLSSFERDILLLCAGVELDTRIALLVAQAHDEPKRSTPTFGLAPRMRDGDYYLQSLSMGKISK